tara:strand:- start:239 stop:586 length:348 start_codon:yes stop_codon:yes gene_type:complete
MNDGAEFDRMDAETATTPTPEAFPSSIDRSGPIVADVAVPRLRHVQALRSRRQRPMANRGAVVDRCDPGCCRIRGFHLAPGNAAFRPGMPVTFQIRRAKRDTTSPAPRDDIAAAA